MIDSSNPRVAVPHEDLTPPCGALPVADEMPDDQLLRDLVREHGSRLERIPAAEPLAHRPAPIPGGAARQLRRLLECCARHQAVDPLVHVAQPLLKAHHCLAVGGETEMAWLDDARVHRADGDLVHRWAFGGMEGVGVAGCRRGIVPTDRLTDAPTAMVDPAARIRRGLGLQAVEIANGALKPMIEMN